MSSENKTYSGYSTDVKAKFAELGGRLFLVDYSKKSAAESLSALIGGGSYSSFLMIVETPSVARGYAKMLASRLGEVKVVDSAKEIESTLGSVNKSVKALTSYASTFGNNYKNLIVSRIDEEGNDVFGKRLCDDDTKAGVFSGEYSGTFTYLDLIAEVGYEFVAIDGIYDILEFIPEPEQTQDMIGGNENVYAPGKYDRIDFLGKNYYAPVSRSFSKLRHVTTRAKGCVAISDVVAVSDGVELYATLNLLTANTSVIDLRNKVKPAVDSASGGMGGYDDACDVIYSNILGGKDDDGVVSDLIQKTNALGRYIQSDIESMKRYLSTALSYMSMEEIFLGVIDAEMKKRGGTAVPSVNDIIEGMLNYQDTTSNYFVDILFRDSVKLEYEASLSRPLLYELSTEELTRVYALFKKYGAYHYVDTLPERIKILRIKRDNSAFEYFARRFSKNDIDDELCYTVLGDATDNVFKCVELSRLADGRDSGLGFSSPAVIVTDNLAAKDIIKQAMTGYTYSDNLSSLAAGGNKTYTVVTFEQWRQEPVSEKLGSVIFFDIDPAVVRLKILIAKAAVSSTGSIFILTSYGNMGGALADKWQSVIEFEEPVIPFEIAEVSLHHGIASSYPEVVGRINGVYEQLYRLVTYGDDSDLEALPDSINGIIESCSTDPTFPATLASFEIDYAARLGEDFNGVFANTSSVGGNGEAIFIAPREHITTVKGKAAAEEPEIKTYDGAFFNVCSKILLHDCDATHNNCADCAEYKKFIRNGYEALTKHLGGFFTAAKKYSLEIAELRKKMSEDGIIFNGHDEGAFDLTKDEVDDYARTVTRAVEVIAAYQSKREMFFHTEYAEIACIREAVYQMYRKVLRKYYKALMIIFNNATDLAKKALDSARDAVTAQLES